MTFYDLKKSLFFPRIAGVLHQKKDVPFLYDLLVSERVQSEQNNRASIGILAKAHKRGMAERLTQDAKMLNEAYGHDIKLCHDFIEQEGMSFI